MKRLPLLLFAAALLYVHFDRPARADLIPPEQAACATAKAGDGCKLSDGSGGTCRATKCRRLDYARWDRDASAGPPTVEYECTTCVLAGGGDSGASDAGSTRGDGATGGEGTDGGSVRGDAGIGPSDDGNDDSGCAFARRGAARSVGPWLLAAVSSLLLLRRRRR